MAEAIHDVSELAQQLIILENVPEGPVVNVARACRQAGRIGELDRQIAEIFEKLFFKGKSYRSEERWMIVQSAVSGCEEALRKLTPRLERCHGEEELDLYGRIFLFEDQLSGWLISFEGGSLGVMDPPRTGRLTALCQAAAETWVAAIERISPSTL